MNFVAKINGAAKRAEEHQECAICFEDLSRGQLASLCKANGSRACSHTFHSECLIDLSKPWCCPLCRTSFDKMVDVPPLAVDPKKWFDYLDTDQDGALGYDEIIEGLKSQVKLDWIRIEADVDSLWSQWDRDKNGSINFAEFAHPETGVMKYLMTHYPNNPRPPPPDIRRDKMGWFSYWDEDRSGLLDKDEVARALIKTFRLYNIDRSAVVGTLDVIWPIFDSDNSGTIDLTEFVATDGLADTISAQLYVS